MRIVFLLPGAGHNPVGGFKVVYEYANGLADRGHEVTVVHAPRGHLSAYSLAVFAVKRVGLRGGYKPDAWFRRDPRVHARWVATLHPRWIPDSDIVVATAWQTAEWMSRYPKSKGRKHYLIQGDERVFPGADPERVAATWRLPAKKIVISRWLEAVLKESGESAAYVPNGLDLEAFGLDRPSAGRDPYRLVMLHHNSEWKGAWDGLEAMRLVRQEVPELQADLFGVPSKPKNLPPWVTYWQRPSTDRLRTLYNEAAIFVGPSWSEGWGLPGCEAAQCGAALCVTDIGGHREYAVHEETALLSPPKDPEPLAANVLRLIRDHNLRLRLTLQGHQHVQRFTWERAVSRFEEVINQVGR